MLGSDVCSSGSSDVLKVVYCMYIHQRPPQACNSRFHQYLTLKSILDTVKCYTSHAS